MHNYCSSHSGGSLRLKGVGDLHITHPLSTCGSVPQSILSGAHYAEKGHQCILQLFCVKGLFRNH